MGVPRRAVAAEAAAALLPRASRPSCDPACLLRSVARSLPPGGQQHKQVQPLASRSYRPLSRPPPAIHPSPLAHLAACQSVFGTSPSTSPPWPAWSASAGCRGCSSGPGGRPCRPCVSKEEGQGRRERRMRGTGAHTPGRQRSGARQRPASAWRRVRAYSEAHAAQPSRPGAHLKKHSMLRGSCGWPSSGDMWK